MTQTPTVAYPPTAAQSARADASDEVVSEQPKAAERMSLDGPVGTKREARRLRGGCIPCPDGSVCYIIPIPCCCL
ncbi:hypothetical protein H2248_007915 [Termitomyces sp. 'cryptogamus']|nr:hypothetical protein H2248_007915 [Termitomyces sp. 'cryptogamus']